MSAMGQKQTLRPVCAMSALLSKADIDLRCWNVRFVPIADICRPDTFGDPQPMNEHSELLTGEASVRRGRCCTC